MLTERQRVLALADKRTKHLDFLAQNRLIFLFQRNIVAQMPTARYTRWFKFAEKSHHKENTAADFVEFQGDAVFEEIMRRLNQSAWTADDVEYIEHEHEMWAAQARIEQQYYADGRAEGFYEGHVTGRAEGQRQQALTTAREMLADGLDYATIIKYTGLSSAVIADLTAD